MDSIQEVSLLELLNALLKRRKLLFLFPLFVAVLSAIVSLMMPTVFTARATFVPEAEEGQGVPAGFGGLAAQFGVALPGGGTSAQFYAELLGSRTLRDAILTTSFPDPRTPTPGDSATLVDVLDVRGESPEERLYWARQELEGRLMSVGVEPATGIIAVTFTSEYPALCAAVTNLLVDMVSSFDMDTRQTQAGQRRIFIEQRVEEAGSELHESEEVLRAWLTQNREWQGSPTLSFEHDRLERQVRIKEEVFSSLRRQFEEARIAEVNDTPVVTVIDQATPPARKSGPRRTLIVIFAGLIGGVLAMTLAFAAEFMERSRVRGDANYQAFSSEWARFKRQLRLARD